MSDRSDVAVSSGSTPWKLPTAPRDADPLKGVDANEWAREQAALIRAGRDREIERLNVAHEIESVGKSDENPSLKAHIALATEVAYRPGRRVAARQTELNADSVPLACPRDRDALTSRAHVLDRSGGPS